MSLHVIALKSSASTSMMGMRRTALPLRKSVEDALAQGQEVTLDFTDVDATQSFIDELVGVLVSKLGPSALAQLAFKGCSPELRGVINFVVADRARDFLKATH